MITDEERVRQLIESLRDKYDYLDAIKDELVLIRDSHLNAIL